ncbi:MAG: DUF3995 domain-containing protein [Thermoanaerobaculia bacterium]|nr:MAG: DUF3995 domain-containing protein [Thermoanaerobaculia bacterium]MBZ0103813.1 DUF3995 domain-containing protein [Thermoanaerobaculia bacterium]
MQVAIVLAGVFFLLAGLHVAWLFRPGSAAPSAVVPSLAGKPVLTTGPVATAIVAGLLAAAGVICLWRVGVLAWPYPAIPRAGVWVLAIVFAGRAVGDFRYVGFFKRVRDSTFARYDTALYSPLCVAIALAAFYLAAFGGAGK